MSYRDNDKTNVNRIIDKSKFNNKENNKSIIG